MPEKVSNVLSKIFGVLFSAVFIWLLFSIISVGYRNNTESQTYDCSNKQYIAIILGAIIGSMTLFLLYYCFTNFKIKSKRIQSLNKDKTTIIAIISMALLMLAVQLLFCYKLAMQPVTDVEIIDRYAMDFAKTGSMAGLRGESEALKNAVYLIRYPNNLAIYFILAFTYRINYLLTGYVSHYAGMILNTIAINSSVLMTALLSRKMFGNRKGLLTMLLCMVFVPFYTYTPYYYSDSLSLPFTVGALYCLYSGLHSNKKIMKYVLVGLSGILMMLSFKIKGFAIILFVAACIYIVLKFKGKQLLCFGLSLLMGFGFAYGAWKVTTTQLIPEEMSYAYEYPASHWVMMGIKGHGGYNDKDSKFTRSFENKDIKQEKTIEEYKNRVSKYLNGEENESLYKHLQRKIVWTWEDGTYYISHHIEKPLKYKTILHQFILNDGKYHFVLYLYCCGFQLFMILMMILSSIKSVIEKKINATLLLRLTVFGLFLFLIFWETRSRYLYWATPIFLLLSIDGLESIKLGVEFPQKISNLRVFNKFKKINRMR